MVRARHKTLPLVKHATVTTGSGSGGPDSSAFALTVTGSNPKDLRDFSQRLADRLKAVPNLVNVTTDLQQEKPQISIKVDPDKALQHGSSAIQIAAQVRGLLTSQKLTSITIDNTPYDVMVGYDPTQYNSLDAIKAIKVGAVAPVALSEIAEVTQGTGAVSISRVDQEQAVTVQGTITSKDISAVQKAAAEIQNDLKASQPATVKVSAGGSFQQFAEALGQLMTALIIAIGLVYIVMVLFFGSLSTPFVIMFSLPLAFIGSFLALWITGKPFGISAMIGLLMLVGIVVTNAIVLLDMVEQHKRLGYSTYDSLIHGGRVRVRPILMTAIATIIALIPLAISNEGSLIASELGTVVIGGLFTSTLLTLVVVPVVYSLLDGLRRRLTRRQRDEATPPAAAPPAGHGPDHSDGRDTKPVLVGASSQAETT
jgi:HAE1 family hydrophobic/amphiphilic exporter-1